MTRQTDEERAAQIEADAGIAHKCLHPKNDQSDWTGYARQHAADAIEVRQAILSQPHDRTALDRIIAATRAKALRDAAELMKLAAKNCRDQYTYPPKTKEQRDYMTGAIVHENAAAAILAMIDKEGA